MEEYWDKGELIMEIEWGKPKDIHVRKVFVRSNGHRMAMLVLSPKERSGKVPGILWIHGGGYATGMKEMVYMSRAVNLVRKFGAVVVSPGYRLSIQAPYPAAFLDCYHALLYLKKHARELGVREDQIMVGGESAGGGLCAAVCMAARDKGTVNVAYQMPLYPMLDHYDTESSRDNHGHIWNTKRNHMAWRLYLRGNAKADVPTYASPARQNNYAGLPPAYTFVSRGEPFYTETCNYIQHLQEAGVEASMDVYPGDTHAFDMLYPEREESRKAIRKFEEQFAYAKEHFFAEQTTNK